MRQGNDQKDPKNGTEDKVDRGRGTETGDGGRKHRGGVEDKKHTLLTCRGGGGYSY